MRPATSPLLALQRQRPGTFALLIAATCLLMLLATALVLALRAAAHDVAETTHGRMLVQVIEPDPARRDAIAAKAMDRLDRTTGLISAHRVSEQEAQALIAPYISGVSASDLPLPAMIEVRTSDRAAVARALASLPGLQLTNAGAELGALARLIDALRGIAFGIALTAAVATGLIAMLSARAALAREAGTLGILHALGATDRQLSRLVTGKIARDALIGAAIGLVVGLFVILTIASRIAALGSGMDPRLGPVAWATLILIPLLLVGLSVAAAQGALLLTLRRAP